MSPAVRSTAHAERGVERRREPEQHEVPLASAARGGGPDDRPAGGDETGDAAGDGGCFEREVGGDAAGQKQDRRDDERRQIDEEIGAKSVADSHHDAVARREQEHVARTARVHDERDEHQQQRDCEGRLRVVAQVRQVRKLQPRRAHRRRAQERGDPARDLPAQSVRREGRRAEQRAEEGRKAGPADAEKRPCDSDGREQITPRALKQGLRTDLQVGGQLGARKTIGLLLEERDERAGGRPRLRDREPAAAGRHHRRLEVGLVEERMASMRDEARVVEAAPQGRRGEH